jgi:hypothetical protein
MFETKAQAEALVLALEAAGHVVDTDLHGVDWEHRKYVLEVRPAGQQPFRVETTAKVPILSKPQEGDTVTVSYEPKSHKTHLDIDGDPRYDPKLIYAARKQQAAASKEALLSGAPVPAMADLMHFTDVFDDEPLWTVPAACPECGARVDQATASMAEDPRCEFCHRPLPCERTLLGGLGRLLGGVPGTPSRPEPPGRNS